MARGRKRKNQSRPIADTPPKIRLVAKVKLSIQDTAGDIIVDSLVKAKSLKNRSGVHTVIIFKRVKSFFFLIFENSGSISEAYE